MWACADKGDRKDVGIRDWGGVLLLIVSNGGACLIYAHVVKYFNLISYHIISYHTLLSPYTISQAQPHPLFLSPETMLDQTIVHRRLQRSTWTEPLQKPHT